MAMEFTAVAGSTWHRQVTSEDRRSGLVLDREDDSGASLPPVPLVSIVIPCRNEVTHIERCLQGILSFEAPPGGFEVLVVDGMSDDGTREVLARIARADPRIRVLDNPKRTTPCALNVGISEARGSIIARIDAHTEYAPDYLCRCLEVMQETGADNVGGPWVARGRTYIQRAIAAAFSSPFGCGGARGHRERHEGPVDTVYLGCWRREFLERIGGFDEEFVRNQDDELNLRLSRAGGRIWQSPRIRSWYSPRSSLSTLFRQYFQYGYWKVRVIQKHRRPASIGHIVPGSFVGTLASLALASPFAPEAHTGLVILLGVYLASALAAAVVASARRSWCLLPVLPLVFAIYHFGYGLGSLIGIYDFAIRGQRAGRYVRLTRGRV